METVGVFCMDCGAPDCRCTHGFGEHDYDITNGCESCECEGYVAMVEEEVKT